MKFNTIKDLLDFTEKIKGRTFKEIDKLNLLEKNKNDKGVLGKVVESGFYGYPLNNDMEADFSELGIELKVSGFEITKKGLYAAKERISLSMINYHTIVHEEFEFSKFITKNKKLLIIWYEYIRGIDYGDFKIWNYQLYDMSQDEDIIKNDFYIIRDTVSRGEAHLLSEGDTSYLGAATKGAGGQFVSQPYSDELARPRAFSLKHSYIRGILRNYKEKISLELQTAIKSMDNKLTNQNAIPEESYLIREQPANNSVNYELEKPTIKTVKDYVLNRITPYIGLTQIEIYEKLSGNKIVGKMPKNLSKMISDLMIGKDKELPEIHDLFSKTSYVIKNVPVYDDYTLIERLTFRTLKQSEFLMPWEDSEWKQYFEETTIILVCYDGRNKSHGYRILKGMKKITFNADDIDNFGKTYKMIQNAIEMKNKDLLPTPNSFENQALEIAPKGGKGADAYETFFNQNQTKTCFMMNKDFVKRKMLDK